MADLRITRHLDETDVDGVGRLIERVSRADGVRPIDEHRWVDAVNGRSDLAALLLTADDELLGYAQATREQGSWAIDLVVDPRHRDDAMTPASQLLGAAVDLVATEGGGQVSWWVHDPTDAHSRIAQRVDLSPGRDLWQMRVPLPLEETTDLVTRPFVPGQDEGAWLEVNNAAFAWHPDQGGWTIEDVHERQDEAWFDPGGFLLHERDGRLAGFCWTKRHEEPPVGEIYVIAVHPDFAGQGLGRALTVAGLAHLSTGTDTGMLYVEADNTPAVRLYEDLGFTVHSVTRAYVGAVRAGA